jgi:hypothetical protein
MRTTRVTSEQHWILVIISGGSVIIRGGSVIISGASVIISGGSTIISRGSFTIIGDSAIIRPDVVTFSFAVQQLAPH